jgi:AcrR family transcriptional regulator
MGRASAMREIVSNIKKPELVAKRREQIITAAMDLFRKQGYHATTMRQICEKSGVNRGSFYDYFGGKEDLLIYIYRHMMYRDGDLGQSFAKIDISKFKELKPFIKETVDASWTRNKDLIQLLYQESKMLDPETLRVTLRIASDYVKWFAESLRQGLKLPAVTEELEIMANAIVYLHAFISLRGWNMKNLDLGKISDFIVDMLMLKLKEMRSEAKKAERTSDVTSLPV